MRVLDRLLQAFYQKGLLEIGKAEFRIRKAKEDGGGTAFADFVWMPLVLIEMKKRGTDLARNNERYFGRGSLRKFVAFGTRVCNHGR